MAKLWLTYAWKDNENEDVDHVIAELTRAGIEVRYDRVQLLAGRRLWDQIDSAMNDPDVGAWAVFVTENSLKSEPCQEEIAYALDRALRTGRGGYPLIGIFPNPIDRALIPSAIATRLYVSLRDPQWAQQVAAGVTGTRTALSPAPDPYGYAWHVFNGEPVLEVWPRSGRWFPFVAAVPAAGNATIPRIMFGPRGYITGTGMTTRSEITSQNGSMKGWLMQHAIDAATSAHIFFDRKPSLVEFGDPNGSIFSLTFS